MFKNFLGEAGKIRIDKPRPFLYFILKIVFNFKESMLQRSPRQMVYVCSGPGCRAWGADTAAQELSQALEVSSGEGHRVCRVACMSRCGGGASVRSGKKGPVLKVRDPEETVSQILPGALAPAG